MELKILRFPELRPSAAGELDPRDCFHDCPEKKKNMEWDLLPRDDGPLNPALRYESESRKRNGENYYAKSGPRFSDHC